ncbi:hypothetical protein LOC68_13555 [Blastopirellula sp. JC732]|uniref:Uncharacterized protein n=1 Tax=Blastopirellula sediminis TaxID=2894196 RepID=A0A9X1MNC8_9BACT|nr:hypothetical protein [Blastopirellula sediminis]MCC9607287.1 hypothetical protein [Blastopirellula sediminis]MCC9629420.1 hypothetical protein [Blastopirellula sediminis]
MSSRLELIARHALAPAILIAIFLGVSYGVELLTFSNTHAIFLWLHDTGEFGSVPHTHRLAIPLWMFPFVTLATLALLTFLSYGLTRLWASKRTPPADFSRTAERDPIE